MEAAASRFEIGDDLPRFPLDILRAMRAEVDALLSFLLAESKTETADYGAQIHNSPTKSVRRRATVRDAMPEAYDRAAELSGMPDARDRADAGQRQKRGGQP